MRIVLDWSGEGMLFRGREEMPCLNCRLIEMGEMACYADTCPQCHRAPPGQVAREEGLRASTTYPPNLDFRSEGCRLWLII